MQISAVDSSGSAMQLAPALGRWYVWARGPGGSAAVDVSATAPPSPDGGPFGLRCLVLQFVNRGADDLVVTLGDQFAAVGGRTITVAPATSTHVRFAAGEPPAYLVEQARASGAVA